MLNNCDVLWLGELFEREQQGSKQLFNVTTRNLAMDSRQEGEARQVNEISENKL